MNIQLEMMSNKYIEMEIKYKNEYEEMKNKIEVEKVDELNYLGNKIQTIEMEKQSATKTMEEKICKLEEQLDQIKKENKEEINNIEQQHKETIETLTTTFINKMNAHIAATEINDVGPSHSQLYELQQKIELQSIDLIK